MSRRPGGSLEHEILGVLWKSEVALMPADVLERLSGDLAYTTVMTVLTRLWQKQLVSRHPNRRGFAYQAAVSEPELTSKRINEILETTDDRSAALAGFVLGLSKRDAKAVRGMLDRTRQT